MNKKTMNYLFLTAFLAAGINQMPIIKKRNFPKVLHKTGIDLTVEEKLRQKALKARQNRNKKKKKRSKR